MNNPNNPTTEEKETQTPYPDPERVQWRPSSSSVERSERQQKAPKKTYAEKLKDPRWQKKRLEVLQAADWKCSRCGDGNQTLHVHHPRYINGLEPWEYDNLVSLCEICHTEEHGDSPKSPSLEETTKSLEDHIAMVEEVGLQKGGDFTSAYLMACRRCVFMEKNLLVASQMLYVTLTDPADEKAREIALSFANIAVNQWGIMRQP